ncbi:hypothetical protein [Acetilactobacillus jinshanensis]|uniref:Methyl-accepting chemotaxis protein n=1 Tax=Acetilactobacillus jinshanensis TaxID=1720083 RepID=A0A4P6ZKW4_9LACO|nr:hypothetical protein [Acetilactobacillus jinshanensis]QBP18203.1 hypothetical protein ELX58_03420 [Acetilactobacillus jinshanensis]
MSSVNVSKMPHMFDVMSNMSRKMDVINANVASIRDVVNSSNSKLINTSDIKMIANLDHMTSSIDETRRDLVDMLVSDIKMIKADINVTTDIYNAKHFNLQIIQNIKASVAAMKSSVKDARSLTNSSLIAMADDAQVINPIIKAHYGVHVDDQVDTISSNLDDISYVVNSVSSRIIMMMDNMLDYMGTIIANQGISKDIINDIYIISKRISG